MRIEQLLDQVQQSREPRARERTEELVALVTELYGAGLSRVLAICGEESPALVRRLVDDELVGHLLMVHGLHPVDVRSRVEQALDSVRPMLAQHEGDVELLDIDPEVGAVHLRLLGSCDGCPSSAVTLRTAVERAIGDAAPEIGIFEVDDSGDNGDNGPELPPGSASDGAVPIRLTRKPVYTDCPSEMVVG